MLMKGPAFPEISPPTCQGKTPQPPPGIDYSESTHRKMGAFSCVNTGAHFHGNRRFKD
nr:MAG TPA_asm: hypothetical protein [Caudoviricetes sp.]DAN03343.1 MAG TPA: hypothetical protein [Caudoviricetes sp.]